MAFDEARLDNPVWHALGGAHRHLALRSVDATALRYRSDVSIFGAVDELTDDGWLALLTLTGSGGGVAVMRAHIPPTPPAVEEVFRGVAVQMIAPPVDPAPAGDVVELGAGDVDDMVDLVARTRPGPFERRTPELGTYLGVRREGRLVAMAGERFRVGGATEISAVCTDDVARGIGLGRLLTLEVARRIQARGEVAFLHVDAENTGAHRLYEHLGFVERRRNDVVAVVVPG